MSAPNLLPRPVCFVNTLAAAELQAAEELPFSFAVGGVKQGICQLNVRRAVQADYRVELSSGVKSALCHRYPVLLGCLHGTFVSPAVVHSKVAYQPQGLDLLQYIDVRDSP